MTRPRRPTGRALSACAEGCASKARGVRKGGNGEGDLQWKGTARWGEGRKKRGTPRPRTRSLKETRQRTDPRSIIQAPIKPRLADTPGGPIWASRPALRQCFLLNFDGVTVSVSWATRRAVNPIHRPGHSHHNSKRPLSMVPAFLLMPLHILHDDLYDIFQPFAMTLSRKISNFKKSYTKKKGKAAKKAEGPAPSGPRTRRQQQQQDGEEEAGKEPGGSKAEPMVISDDDHCDHSGPIVISDDSEIEWTESVKEAMFGKPGARAGASSGRAPYPSVNEKYRKEEVPIPPKPLACDTGKPKPKPKPKPKKIARGEFHLPNVYSSKNIICAITSTSTENEHANIEVQANTLHKEIENWTEVQHRCMSKHDGPLPSLIDPRHQIQTPQLLVRHATHGSTSWNGGFVAPKQSTLFELFVMVSSSERTSGAGGEYTVEWFDREGDHTDSGYRSAQPAIWALGAHLGRDLYSQQYPVLAPEDVRSLREDADGATTGRSKNEPKKGDTMESVSGQNRWCTSRARSMRWAEEVELVVEEMRRVKASFEHRASEWDQRAAEAGIIAPGVEIGRQAAQFRAMRAFCEKRWALVSEFVSSGGTTALSESAGVAEKRAVDGEAWEVVEDDDNDNDNDNDDDEEEAGGDGDADSDVDGL
ncbi:hypothetical protein DFP72DRAFT_1049351 [Ephemerocybe angulata]|uniref:Uncharacterized protein n=1 Tax=Ephemerocybe angulata TaxID=980116 RepID=A0A8H6HLT2_9AGAR|nr:hypothetical protein DFP72DRAFT_1049351 [Tulosesus angulatus]